MGEGPKQWLFDVWARFYDVPLVQRLVYRPPQTAVVAALRDAHVARVLDVGCGTGQLTARLRRELVGSRVAGLDFSAGMLEQARRRDPAGSWVRGDAQRLPFRDGCFDAVVSTEAFHWFPDPDAALAEFRRVLRPRGMVLLALVNLRLAITGAVVSQASRLVGQPFHWPTAGELRARLSRQGFRVVRQARLVRLPGMLVFPPVLTIARRGRGSARSKRG